MRGRWESVTKIRSSGFGSSDARHGGEFARGLQALGESLDAAESYARNGDCYAMMDEAARAFELRGTVNTHRDAASARERGTFARNWVALGTRLNFLRQSMKRCVR